LLEYFKQIDGALDTVTDKLQLRSLDLYDVFMNKKTAEHNFNNKVLVDILAMAMIYTSHALWFNVVKVAVEKYVQDASAFWNSAKSEITKLTIELGIEEELIPKIIEGFGAAQDWIAGTDPWKKVKLRILKDTVDRGKVIVAAAKQNQRFA
jgi:hypothetical protein